MEVREAGDVIFHRSTQLSTAPGPWRMWAIVFLQGWSLIRWLQRKDRLRDFKLFTRVLHLHGTEGNALTDLCPVHVILQRELSYSWEAIWSRGGRREGSVEEARQFQRSLSLHSHRVPA